MDLTIKRKMTTWQISCPPRNAFVMEKVTFFIFPISYHHRVSLTIVKLNEYISITQLNLDRNRDSVCQRERERERERESLSSWRICCLDTMATTQLTKIPLTPGYEWFLLTIGVLHIALFHHDEWKFTGISCAIHAFIDFTV